MRVRHAGVAGGNEGRAALSRPPAIFRAHSLGARPWPAGEQLEDHHPHVIVCARPAHAVPVQQPAHAAAGRHHQRARQPGGKWGRRGSDCVMSGAFQGTSIEADRSESFSACSVMRIGLLIGMLLCMCS